MIRNTSEKGNTSNFARLSYIKLSEEGADYNTTSKIVLSSSIESIWIGMDDCLEKGVERGKSSLVSFW